ncbi:MAG: glycerate kinase family protein [Bacteroidales bacterium]
MKKIVIAADSFKGSLSSLEIADSAESAIKLLFPRCEVVKIPIADGGEGTVDAIIESTNGRRITCRVHDPLMREIDASYGILGDGRTAVIEMATASGLPLLSPSERNPWIATTYGTGELILDAIKKGCRSFLIGIGGSATNDAGSGMLRALGFVFKDESGNELTDGGQILSRIKTVETKTVVPLLKDCEFKIACDVNNPFYGMNGAAWIYSRQKGADDMMIEALDKGLVDFANLIKSIYDLDISTMPGAGAAGGLGGAFVAFLNGELVPGIGMVLDAIDFNNRIQGADLIITGEGRMDAQTCMGKAPVGVLRVAQKQAIPVIGICGSLQDSDVLIDTVFLSVVSIQSAPVSLETAMQKEYAQKNISRTVFQLLRLIQYYQQ